MNEKRHIKWLFVLGVMLIMMPMTAQDMGNGIIVVPNLHGVDNIGSLNPLLCNNADCRRVTDWLFPYLIDIDLTTGQIRQDNYALATGWEVADDWSHYELMLNEDAVWSDGTPITAYDVAYSFLVVNNDEENTVVPIDDHIVAVYTQDVDCGTVYSLNFPVIPSHIFAPTFAEDVGGAVGSPDEYVEQAIAAGYDDFSFLYNHPFSRFPDVTDGRLMLRDVQIDNMRFSTLDNSFAINMIDVENNSEAVAKLLVSDEITFMDNLPLRWLNDMGAHPDILTVSNPNFTSARINLNLIALEYDRSGEVIREKPNPYFADVRVRQALRMAIDVPAISDAVFYGEADALLANAAFDSWVYDDTLASVEYDPMAASRLLDEAGWPRLSRGGVRQCINCLYAIEGRILSFDLLYADTRESRIVTKLIAQQLNQIGVQVQSYAIGYNDMLTRMSDKRFDAAMLVSPFSLSEYNYGSFDNPQYADLMNTMLHVPQCDAERIASLYGEIQAIVHEELPVIGLYSMRDVIAVRDSVVNFEPTTPFSNITQWRIWRGYD